MNEQQANEESESIPPNPPPPATTPKGEHEPAATRRERPDWRKIISKVFDEHDELFRKLAEAEKAGRAASSNTP